jgi:hypothetical protein
MDPEAEAILNRIRHTEISALTQPDIEFLYSRRSYLGPRDSEKYREIFGQLEKQRKIKPTKVEEVEEVDPNAFPPEEIIDETAEETEEKPADEDGEDEAEG